MRLKDKHYGTATKKRELNKNITISEGYKYLRILRLDNAISCFETILSQDANNIKSLLGRAKCFMRLGMYQNAEVDFQQVLQLNPKCTEAIYLKGATEYIKGDFEKGFLTYSDGHELLPSRDPLKQGCGMCETAIENTLNPDVPVKIVQKDINRASLSMEKFQALGDDTPDIGEYSKTGLFSTDLKLLHCMLEDKNIAQCHPLCKDLFNYLRERQKFWKMQNPRQMRNTMTGFTFVKWNGLDSTKVNQLIRSLRMCKMSLLKRKPGYCIKKGLEALDILKNVSSEQFPKKGEIEAEILHNLAMACVVDGDFDSSLKYCEQQLSVTRKSKVLEDEERALEDLGDVYMRKKMYSKALEFFTECLQLAQKEYSRTMLLYKISDCKVHLNRLDKARCIANQCLDFALRTENTRFQSNVLLLLAEVAIKGKEMKEAEKFCKKALEIATKENDPREKDLKMLLQLLEAVALKDSCSEESIKILRFSNQIKHNI